MAMVPAVPGQQVELMVVDEEERGYEMGERILRPARVVVARK
jgi:molecular chaperone GrpE (heat shock protein)